MQITREDLNPCTVQLKIVCDPEEVKEGYDRALKQVSKNIKLPGFRPGHVPRKILEQHISKEDLTDAAVDKIVNTVYKNALKEQELEPYGRASIEITELNAEENRCEFTAKVPLKPVVDLGSYEELEAERPSVDVTDEEVEHHLEEMRRRKSTREAITDRGVQEGDMAVINIKLDGEEGDGRNFMTVAGQTFPQLDQAIMGMNPEEMKVLDLTFPENFQEKDWAGKPYRCQITIRNLSSIKLPDLDDEFSKSYNLDNIEDLRKGLREHIGIAKQEAVQEHVNEQLLDQILQRSTIHVPDTMWEQVATDKLQQMSDEQKEQNRTLEQYAEQNGMSVEELVEAVKQEAKTYVLRAQIINEIFLREKMTLSNTELNQELLIMARANNMEPQELLNVLQKNNQVQEIHYAAVNRKVMNFLNSKARMKEPVTA